MDETLEIMLSIVTLALLSTGTFFVARRIRLPYTILLVVVGLLLIPVSQFPFFSYLASFKLTPELLFFVFLPTLIFESAYNMNIKKMLESIRSISLLAVVSLLVSALAIAFGLTALLSIIGYPIPFSVALLFGSLISATDPVAVLSLFKEYGAPSRLSLIFEGESLLNDGTSLALFLIILETLTKGYQGSASVFEGIFLFISMITGGILLGALMGGIFSKLIERVHNNEHIEITLTLIVAHLTFLTSEVLNHYASIGGQEIRFSSIIATMIAAMMVGNYGRYKISPQVEEYMEKFWGYFAFLSNSIVFVLIGLILANLPIDLTSFVIPALCAIVVVMIARALSVYGVIGALNLTKSEKHIPLSWQHLLAWGSLRGALAVTMVLLIPDTFSVPGWSHPFSVKEFLTGLVITCIYFTLFIKATTIGPFMNMLGLTKLSQLENVEREESKLLVYARILKRLSEFRERRYVNENTYEKVRKIYEGKYHEAEAQWKVLSVSAHDLFPRLLHVHAVGVQKHVLKILFTYREVNEVVFKKILGELSSRLGEIASGNPAILPRHNDTQIQLAEKFEQFLQRRDFYENHEALYMYHRAKMILARKAGKELCELLASGTPLSRESETFEKIITQYKHMEESSREKVKEYRNNPEYQKDIQTLDEHFTLRGIFKEKQKMLKDFNEKEMISRKLSTILAEEFQEEERLADLLRTEHLSTT